MSRPDKRKSSPFLVGLFVLGAVALAVAAVSVWGSARLFQKKYVFVCYFKDSVNGLSIGAPVKYRGVAVGQVTDIRLRFSQKADDRRVPVFVEIDATRARELIQEAAVNSDDSSFIAQLVQRGLRAQLGNQSYVTGQLYVSLDFFPKSAIELSETGSHLPEVPTVQTPLEQLGETVTDIVNQLKKADVAEQLTATLQGVRLIVNNPGLHQALTDLPEAVHAVTRLADDPGLHAAFAKLPGTLDGVEKSVDGMGQHFGSMTASLSSASQHASDTLDTVRSTVAPDSRLIVDLDRTLLEVQKAARSVSTLAEDLERNPSSILLGRKSQ